MLDLDLDDDKNYLKTADIHVGFAAVEELKKLLQKDVVTVKQVKSYKVGARPFIIGLLKKMKERCPLLSPIVQNVTCLNPEKIRSFNITSLKKKLQSFITKIVRLKILHFSQGDKTLNQFSKLLEESTKLFHQEFNEFKREICRLDDFYFKTLKIGGKYPELAQVVKLVLILSHGQATVERGFSNNKVVLKDNQTSESIVARRFINDYMIK